MSRNSKNYVNNKEFYKKMKDFIESGEKDVPEDISLTIYQICSRLATKANFCGYSYKDDMVMFAFEQCFKNVRKFDPSKSNNPFAYFTQIAYNAFIKIINDEKKQQAIKMYLAKSNVVEDEYEDDGNGSGANKMAEGLRKYYRSDIINDSIGVYDIDNENMHSEVEIYDGNDFVGGK